LRRRAWLIGRDQLLMIHAKAIPAGDDLAPFPDLWHILESHRVIFFRFAAARPGRLFAQACAAGREVIAIRCTTPFTVTHPSPSAIQRPAPAIRL